MVSSTHATRSVLSMRSPRGGSAMHAPAFRIEERSLHYERYGLPAEVVHTHALTETLGAAGQQSERNRVLECGTEAAGGNAPIDRCRRCVLGDVCTHVQQRTPID